MNKRIVAAGLSCLLAISTAMPTFAAGWQKDNTGWWWQDDDGSYPTSTWRWLDGNNDGIAESYYFGADGYMLTNTTTPDGYTVNADGEWTVNGALQTQQVTPSVNQNLGYGSEKAIYDAIDAYTKKEAEEVFANMPAYPNGTSTEVSSEQQAEKDYWDDYNSKPWRRIDNPYEESEGIGIPSEGAFYAK